MCFELTKQIRAQELPTRRPLLDETSEFAVTRVTHVDMPMAIDRERGRVNELSSAWCASTPSGEYRPGGTELGYGRMRGVDHVDVTRAVNRDIGGRCAPLRQLPLVNWHSLRRKFLDRSRVRIRHINLAKMVDRQTRGKTRIVRACLRARQKALGTPALADMSVRAQSNNAVVIAVGDAQHAGWIQCEVGWPSHATKSASYGPTRDECPGGRKARNARIVVIDHEEVASQRQYSHRTCHACPAQRVLSPRKELRALSAQFHDSIVERIGHEYTATGTHVDVGRSSKVVREDGRSGRRVDTGRRLGPGSVSPGYGGARARRRRGSDPFGFYRNAQDKGCGSSQRQKDQKITHQNIGCSLHPLRRSSLRLYPLDRLRHQSSDLFPSLHLHV